MPDAFGQMTLLDHRTELKARGFDGFIDADLNSLINRGYLYVCRKVPYYWDMADYTGPVPAEGQLSVADTGALTGFKSVEAVYWKSGAQAIRLRPLNEQEFRENWQEEFQSGVTGASAEVYYIDGNTMWILPKLVSPGSSTITIRYNKRPAPMTADIQVPATPIDLDEVILSAALVRAHKRANETTLALAVQVELDEMLDDIKDLEGSRMQDQQERVSPDNGWL